MPLKWGESHQTTYSYYGVGCGIEVKKSGHPEFERLRGSFDEQKNALF